MADPKQKTEKPLPPTSLSEFIDQASSQMKTGRSDDLTERWEELTNLDTFKQYKELSAARSKYMMLFSVLPVFTLSFVMIFIFHETHLSDALFATILAYMAVAAFVGWHVATNKMTRKNNATRRQLR